MKFEEEYLHVHDGVNETKKGLEQYVLLYNQKKPQLVLDGKTLDEFYFENVVRLPKKAYV